MFYYVVTYSFDPDVPVKGPFADYDQCWEAMAKDAENELRIDTEEASFNSTLKKDEEAGTITLTNLFMDTDDDVTTWQVIDVPYAPAPDITEAAERILRENGVAEGSASEVLQKLIATLFCIPKPSLPNTTRIQRDIAGENVEVAVFGDKMRFSTYGSFYEVPENAEDLLAEKQMRLTRYQDGSACVEVQKLVPFTITDEEMDDMHDALLTEMEKAMGLPEGEELSSSGWHAGHFDSELDYLMTQEEQAIIREVQTHDAK